VRGAALLLSLLTLAACRERGAARADASDSPGRAAAATGTSREGRSPDEKARSWFTDTRLVDQEGREVRFYSDLIEGRVVAMDFVFTRCKMACPLLTEKMNRIREALGPAFGREVSFISMSVDPSNDTPQDLARFAKTHRAVHPAWRWLTGTSADVRRVLGRLGEWVEIPEQHSTELIIGNARTRHWIKIRPDAPAEATALQLQALVAEDSAERDASMAQAARN